MRILVADDEPTIHEMLGQLLPAAGYEVLHAASSRQTISHSLLFLIERHARLFGRCPKDGEEPLVTLHEQGVAGMQINIVRRISRNCAKPNSSLSIVTLQRDESFKVLERRALATAILQVHARDQHRGRVWVASRVG